MTETDVILVIRLTFVTIVKLAAPPLLATLVIGLIVSLLQSVTQVNEATLSFLPKLFAVIAIVLLGGHAMLAILTSFAHAAFDRAVAVGGS